MTVVIVDDDDDYSGRLPVVLPNRWQLFNGGAGMGGGPNVERPAACRTTQPVCVALNRAHTRVTNHTIPFFNLILHSPTIYQHYVKALVLMPHLCRGAATAAHSDHTRPHPHPTPFLPILIVPS